MTNQNYQEFLFLDFDGVLKFGTDDEGNYTKSISLLQQFLLKNPNLDVVLTTTWRHQYSLAQLATLFPENVRKRFVGITPTSMSRETTREFEVMAFIRDYEEAENKKIRFVVLDDRSDLFTRNMPNFVLVRHKDSTSMKQEDIDKAQNLLNDQRHDLNNTNKTVNVYKY